MTPRTGVTLANPTATQVLGTAQPRKPYNETADAHQDIAAAFTKATSEKKYVLLDFGGNWCPDCWALDSYYETEPLKTLVEKNFVIVAIDVGEFKKNLDISKKYGDPITNGVPAVVVLSPDDKIVGTTADGALESARSMNVQQVYNVLQKWTPK